MKHGIVKDWIDMEKIWEHTFYNELRVTPEEHNVMIIQFIRYKYYKEKIPKIMFETFGVKGLYITNQGELSLFLAGKFTGLVVNSGDCVTFIYPIYEGFQFYLQY